MYPGNTLRLDREVVGNDAHLAVLILGGGISLDSDFLEAKMRDKFKLTAAWYSGTFKFKQEWSLLLRFFVFCLLA
jgi:hypothetical protein